MILHKCVEDILPTLKAIKYPFTDNDNKKKKYDRKLKDSQVMPQSQSSLISSFPKGSSSSRILKLESI